MLTDTPSSTKPQRATVKTLAENLIRRCVEAERQFIAGFWLDREHGHDAAVDAALSVLSFSDRRLGFIFWYLCRCTEERITPTMTACLTLAPRADVPLDDLDNGWLYRLILGTDTQAGHVGHYADRVARLTTIRDGRARTALETFTRLATEDQFVVTVTPKRLIHIRGSTHANKRNGRARLVV